MQEESVHWVQALQSRSTAEAASQRMSPQHSSLLYCRPGPEPRVESSRGGREQRSRALWALPPHSRSAEQLGGSSRPGTKPDQTVVSTLPDPELHLESEGTVLECSPQRNDQVRGLGLASKGFQGLPRKSPSILPATVAHSGIGWLVAG